MPPLVTDDASSLHFNRLLKDVAIARSGVYLYTRDEIKRLPGITSIPDKYAKDNVFYVYRPAAVLAANKDKFARQPLTVRHPQGWVTDENFSQLGKGWTGDDVWVDGLNDEIIIRSSVNLVDKMAIKDYDSGVREVSPGYIAPFSWKDGITAGGLRYNIVMDDLESVNHLALVPQGRGGPSVRIIDSGEEVRKLTSGLFRFIKGLFVNDSADEPKSFREVLDESIKNRTAMTDEDFDGVRDNLMPAIDDLPESTEKSALKRMVHDLWSVKKLNDDGAGKYASVVSDLYEKLDKESNQSVADAMGAKMDDEEKKDEVVEDAAEKPAEEVVADTAEAPAEEKAEEKGVADSDYDGRLKALEDQMTKIATMMESFASSKTDAPAAKSAQASEDTKPAEAGVLVAEPKSVGDAAPATPVSPFTATLDSVPSKSPKGVDLEAFDKIISNGGKK